MPTKMRPAHLLSCRVVQIFLDCDGVLADFDLAAEHLLGLPPRQAEEALGTREFWSRIRAARNFFRNLPLTCDAMELYGSVAALQPIILTGCPVGGWAEGQKKEWAAEHFPGVPIIACLSREKSLYLKNAGDVLVDDYLRYKRLWEKAGGIFVHHHSARESIEQLAGLGLPVKRHQRESPPVADDRE